MWIMSIIVVAAAIRIVFEVKNEHHKNALEATGFPNERGYQQGFGTNGKGRDG